MDEFDLSDHSHRRLNVLTNEWILVSPHRAKRPWQGQVEDLVPDERPKYDPSCYLCPGNDRIGGQKNPKYETVYIFDNDFGALLMDSAVGEVRDGLLQARSERGRCRVVCFSPDHSLTLSGMKQEHIVDVVKAWTSQYEELGALPEIRYVQIFENKGSMMGCSNPHPHGQIWANAAIPDIPRKEGEQQRFHYEKTGTALLMDYLQQELEKKERIVYSNEHFVVLVPFWAAWPYEAMILPMQHRSSLPELSEAEQVGFADALQHLSRAYDKLFNISFPYSSGLHQAPTGGGDQRHWQMHMHFYPPLLRSATVKKFMVGYEMMANPQRDFTAEYAAQRLRDCVS